jgi:hypothetical protein
MDSKNWWKNSFSVALRCAQSRRGHPCSHRPIEIGELHCQSRTLPRFFLKPVDPAHFCLKWVLRLFGKESVLGNLCTDGQDTALS